VRVVLVSTYEMGRQPFGLASPAAWLKRAGHEVACVDVSRTPLGAEKLRQAELVGVFLPMHTATRLALGLLPRLRRMAPGARICAYGLYAEINRAQLLAAGCEAVLGAEYEADLVAVAGGARAGGEGALPRLEFVVPDRSGLPPLSEYAGLRMADGSRRVTGYTEATRGCKHRCRHCPITPVYNGQFRAVGAETVLADIRQQVEAGAEHITFGDPDFFNGPTHARRIVAALHQEFPRLSYDVTIKIEHLLRQAELLPELKATGCALVTTAVESFDDAVLEKLDKGHTAADFRRALGLTQAAGLALNPTFVAFTPWTTRASFAAMLEAIGELGLEEQVGAVQYGIRLLVPRGSRLLEAEDRGAWLGDWDDAGLSYRWRALEPEADRLAEQVQAAVAAESKAGQGRREIFHQVATIAGVRLPPPAMPRATVPYLDEPWFC